MTILVTDRPFVLNERKSGTDISIVNLSIVNLCNEESSVLSKCLSFCPGSGNIKELQFYKDLDNSIHRLRLREYYDNKCENRDSGPTLSSVTRWTPPSERDKCLDLYINAVHSDILSEYKMCS